MGFKPSGKVSGFPQDGRISQPYRHHEQGGYRVFGPGRKYRDRSRRRRDSVYYDDSNNVRSVDAVIDKDLASSLLATQIGADELYILTDVPFIFKNFGKPTQEKLEFLDYADTLKYLEAGTFGEGSMAPKIRACLNFVANGGKKSVITEAGKLKDKRYGSEITMHYP